MTTLPQTTSIQLPRPMSQVPAAPSHAPSPLAQAQGPLTGADAWRVIRANMWIIIGSVIVSFLFGFALNWFLNRFYSRYTATGYVRVQPNRGGYNPLGDRNGDNSFDDTTLVVEQRTQAQILRTDSLFTKVLQNQNYQIRNTNWFAQFKNPDNTVDIASAKEDLQKHFSASPIPDSKLIAVSMTFSDPKDTRVIVQDIVNQHIDDQRSMATTQLLSKINVLTQMKTRWEAGIRNARNKALENARQLQLDGFGSPRGGGQLEQELTQLTTERLKAESDASQAAGAYKAAADSLQQGLTPGQVEMMISNNWLVITLKQQLASFEIQLDSMRKQGPASDAYKDILATRDAAVKHLDDVLAEERARNTSAYLDSLKGAADGTSHYLEEVNKLIEKHRNDLAEMSARLAEYLTSKDEEDGLQEQLRQVQKQLDTLNTMSNQSEMNTVAWMQQPETPDIPSFPELKWTLLLCTLMGLAVSLGISFLREIMDTSVRSPRDIARVGQLNLLGMIPHEDDDPQATGVPLCSVIYAAPNSMLAEQFRQVRTRLQHTASLETTRSILVTSPSPGDGKSTVAANLAAGLALNGRRILLVDANFRRPEIHKLFAIGNEIGFGSALGAIENFEAAVRQTRVPNLDIMTTGPKPANATELLESQLLIDFIERALEEYDHVIFDSGPMLVVSETVALAPRVDGVLTVVRARTNSRGVLQRMKENLKQLKAEHLGVVLNGVRSTGGGYYGRNIKTYYEYQNGNAA